MYSYEESFAPQHRYAPRKISEIPVKVRQEIPRGPTSRGGLALQQAAS